jgi:hypothetical protein
LLASAGAQAQNTDDNACQDYLFPSQQEFRLANVVGTAPRVYFFNDGNGCPQKGASCQGKAYVLPGDRLLLGKTQGEWTCAWYQGTSRETVGWVRSRDLAVLAASDPAPADWSGEWKIYKRPGSIRIVRKGGVWQVAGQAFWGRGASTNDGELEGELKIQGRRAHIGSVMTDDADECGAELVRIGDFLIVHDNMRCGGLNVRFDGVYTRTR